MTTLLALLLLQEAEDVRRALLDLAAEKGDWTAFSATYEDLHGLHGGLRLTLHGSGKIEREAVRTGDGPAKESAERKDLLDLVRLLVKQEAWLQKVPERPAVPDESRARLEIRAGGKTVRIWEWFNDLAKNKRMAEIRDRMKAAGLQEK